MLKDLLRYKVDARRLGGALLVLFVLMLAAAYMINRTFTLTFWDRGYEIKADFVDADGIADASDVRIAGTYVGQVTQIRSVSGGLAELTIRIDKAHAPLHEGSRAQVRLQTLLGTKFVDVLPGPSSAAELGSGSVIKTDRTQSPVDFDQILQSFDDPTRKNLSGLVQEAGAATAGRGEDINAFLGKLRDLSVDSSPNLQAFSDRSANLNTILKNLDDVSANLSANRDHLAGVQTHLNEVLGTIADNDVAFKRLITEGDASLGHGLNQFQGESKNINDSIAQLRPALDKLNPTLADIDQVQHQLDPFTKISDVLSSDILSANSGYNHNPNNTSCGPPGCGGFYLRQPSVLANAPADQEHYPNFGASTAYVTVPSQADATNPANLLVGPSLNAPLKPAAPGAAPVLPLPSAPAIPGLKPAGTRSINPQDRALAEALLFAYLLR
jgi:phospholipid/cholesterol/gamma-HCH transport system substrate-binding protein